MRLPDEQRILGEAIKLVTSPISVDEQSSTGAQAANPYGQPNLTDPRVTRSRNIRFSKKDKEEWEKVFSEVSTDEDSVDERWWHNEASAKKEKNRIVKHGGRIYGW